MFHRSCLLVVLTALAAPHSLAQFSLRGSVTGIVSDPSGAAVPAATVKITQLDRNQSASTQTDESGAYRFVNLNPGRYQISVEKEGFKTAVSAQVELATQQTVRADLSLTLGSVSEKVDVTAESALLNTEQSQIGAIVNRPFIEALPMRGRNFSGFAALSPNISITETRGAISTTDSPGARHTSGGIKFKVGGGGDNDYSINGVNSNDNYVDLYNYVPSIEAVEEVKADTSNFSAEYGHNVANVNAATRGGKSQFHGTAYDVFNNNGLNAVNAYTKATVANFKPGVLQKNQFGGNFGGPIIIPKLTNSREKAFFFVNYEKTIQHSGGNLRIVRVPTARERQGDFGELLERFPGDLNYVLYDPFSTTLDASGNSLRTVIPRNDMRPIRRPDGSPLINPDATAKLGLFPLPNGYSNPSNSRDLNNFLGGEKRGYDAYRLDTRFDYRFNPSNNLFVTFARSHGLDGNTNSVFPDLAVNAEDQNFLLTSNFVHIFTPTMTNEFIFGYSRPRFWSADNAFIDYVARPDTLFRGTFKNLDFMNFPGAYQLNISGYPTAGNNPYTVYRPTYQFANNFSWIKGRHAIKAGVNYIWKRDFGPYVSRSANFDNGFTRGGSGDPNPAARSRGGDPMATFLTGTSYRLQTNLNFAGEPTEGSIIPYWGFFIEDRFQISSRLTLSLGLRNDLPLPIYSGDAVGFATMDFAYPGWQLAMPGQAPNLPVKFAPADKNNWAPRVSLAFRAMKDMVVRGSYGIFYSAGTGSTLGRNLDLGFNTNFAYSSFSFTNAYYGVNDAIPYMKFADIFPVGPTASLDKFPVSTGKGTGYYTGSFNASTFRDGASEVVPYYQRWMLETEKSFGGSNLVAVSYVGAHGTSLPYTENLNKPPYRTGWPSSNIINAARPNTVGNRWSDVRAWRSGLNTNYHAATVRFERRMSRGLQLMAHYTFSKSIEESGSWEYNRFLSRQESAFSHPHRFVAAGTYLIPGFTRSHPALQLLLSNWKLGAFVTMESGNALTISNGMSSARDREPERPNLNRNPNLPSDQRSFYRYFDTAAFSDPGQDVKGSAGSGIVLGPGVNNWDASISKLFRITERLSTDFRAEMFNAWNHTQWSGVNTTFQTQAGNTFGRVTGAREPRVIQFTLRVLF